MAATAAAANPLEGSFTNGKGEVIRWTRNEKEPWRVSLTIDGKAIDWIEQFRDFERKT